MTKNNPIEIAVMPLKAQAVLAAVAYLDAVEVAPGRYAVVLCNAWHTVSTDALGAYEIRSDIIALASDAKPMPSWWSPGCRKAWKIVDSVRMEEPDSGARYTYEPCGLPLGYQAQSVTADLETGAEVSGNGNA